GWSDLTSKIVIVGTMKLIIFILVLFPVLVLQAGTPEAMMLLKVHCFSCHNPDKSKGKLDLTTREALLRGGDDGKVVTLGKAAVSRMVQAIQPEADPHMPPKEQLSPRAIEILEEWVNAGVPWDATVLKDQPRPKAEQLRDLPPAYTPSLSLALATDSNRLAVGRANRVVIYDLADKNKIVGRLEGHRDTVQALAWSVDGQWLASSDYRSLRIWNAQFKLTREITGFEGRVTALVFAPDNKSIFAADSQPASSGTVRQWSIAEGKQLAQWKAHKDSIYGLAISKDGKQLATAGGDELAKVWSIKDRNATATLEGHQGAVYDVAFDSKGKQLATASADHQLLIWDLKTKLKTTEIRSHKGGVTALQWTPDDKALASSCEDGVARVFTDFILHDGASRSSTGKEGRLNGAKGRLHGIGISSDAKTVFACNHKGEVYVWQESKLVSTLKVEDVKPASETK
ncbi:uncharacterized protein METZ01_LOCUS245284, partial [marine metagenome]